MSLLAAVLALSACSSSPSVPGLSSAQEACDSWLQMSDRMGQGIKGNPISAGEWAAFAAKVLAAASRATSENSNFGYLLSAATRLQVNGPETGDLDGAIGMSKACGEFRKQVQAESFPAAPAAVGSGAPSSQALGLSGYSVSDEAAYLVTSRSNAILGAVARKSEDKDLLMIAVPICVGVRDAGKTPKQVEASLVEASVDPQYAGELVRVALGYLCPTSASDQPASGPEG